MTKPYSEDLRIRAVEAVANGMSRRQVAKLYKVGAPASSAGRSSMTRPAQWPPSRWAAAAGRA